MCPSCLLVYSIDDTLHQYFTHLIKEIKLREKPYQLTIFINHAESFAFPETMKLLQMFEENIPTMIIDLAAMNQIGDNRTLVSPVFNNPQYVTIYTIFYQNSTIYQRIDLQEYIDLFVRISPSVSRPHCLVILFREYRHLESVLKYAWSKNFFDFTVIQINTFDEKMSERILVRYYNAFFNSFISEPYNSAVPIFPDKLATGNGFELRVPAFLMDPIMNGEIASNGEILNFKCLDCTLMLAIIKHLNFSYRYAKIYDSNSTIREIHGGIHHLLATNEIDMMINDYYPLQKHENTQDSLNILALDLGYTSVNFVAVVPILYNEKVGIDLHLIMYIFINLLCFKAFTILTKLSTALNVHPTEFEFLKILLAQAVTRPQKIRDKVIFLFVVLTSMFYSFTFYSNALGVSIIREEVPFDTIQDVSESNLQPYMLDIGFKILFRGELENHYMNKLKFKTRKIRVIENCLKTFDRNTVCIVSEVYLKSFFHKYAFNKKGEPVMKKPKVVFASQNWKYHFGSASPYISKFHQLLIRLYEAGIQQPTARKDKVVKVKEYSFESEIVAGKAFVTQLISMVAIGYLVASLTFVIELLYFLKKPSSFKKSIKKVISSTNLSIDLQIKHENVKINL